MDSSDFRCYRKLLLWFFLVNGYLFSFLTFAADSFTRGHSIRDGDTIISAGKKFALGFFSPQDSSFRYVGIWYYKVANEPVVWVANRETPISDNGGALTIGNDGNLIVLNGDGDIIWSSNAAVESKNSTAILMDTGNLILYSRGEHINGGMWQSFDHPTDTYLPDMRVQMNIIHDGERRVLTSWKSVNDPSPGNYSVGVDLRGSSQLVIWAGLNRWWRSGYWNELVFPGVPIRDNYLFGFKVDIEGAGNLSFTYTPPNRSDLIKFRVGWDGTVRQERWTDGLEQWNLIESHPVDVYDRYNRCGSFGICYEMAHQKCSCIQGFVAKNSDEWSRGNWSSGCVRRRKLQCEEKNNNSLYGEEAGGEQDGFVQIERVKLPDLVDYVRHKDIKECEKICLENCSCTAYAVVNGIDCMIWNRDLVDVQQFVKGGTTLFVRLAHSELGDESHLTKNFVITVVIVGTFFVCVLIWVICRFKTKCHGNVILHKLMSGTSELGVEGKQASGRELAMFSFNNVAAATDNFCDMNKLGGGGFGHVYKGKLSNGQEIAVKRLAKSSNQGAEEFKNEVEVISELQHRNLVRLLGYCVECEEKMLVYEYMMNGSLDTYIFDSHKQGSLDWKNRTIIIEGICRGLLYLHRDSRLRIIHRDLKPSNILLDEELNPKISDFGMARIFGGKEDQANTTRVVGTFGYMAPEYALEGRFSEKSDVYSFGVLLLEIVSGRKNTSFYNDEQARSLIAYAWKMWNEEDIMNLMDPLIYDPGMKLKIVRYANVGLLCVQEIAQDRPNISTIFSMLSSEIVDLPHPKQPAFIVNQRSSETEFPKTSQSKCSVNEVTVTMIEGR